MLAALAARESCFFSSSWIFRFCSPLSNTAVKPPTTQNIPLNSRARFMLSGGLASGPARNACWAVRGQQGSRALSNARNTDQYRADLQRTNTIEITFPLEVEMVHEARVSVVGKNAREKLGTYVDHRMAELASAFLVISQASSSTTGSMVREHMPMMAITTKIAARLLGLTVKRASPVPERHQIWDGWVEEKPSEKGCPT